MGNMPAAPPATQPADPLVLRSRNVPTWPTEPAGQGILAFVPWGMSLSYLKALRIGSVVFISLPCFIFFGVWLRPGWAVVVLPLLGSLLVAYALRKPAPGPGDGPPDLLPTSDRISRRSLLVIVLLAIVWVSFSGAGGIGFQNLPDWDNKNHLISDLIQYDWPVAYDNGLTLNYYFALYLPAALVGKVAGWAVAQWFLYGCVLAGAFLSLLWVYSFAGELGVKGAILFLAFGGLDVIGYLVTRQQLPRLGQPIEWWATTVQFSSNTTVLFWVPQHGLAGWILTALIFDEAARMRRVAFTGLFVGLCFLWSPFVALGLIPVAIAAYVVAEHRALVSPANFVYLPLVAGLAAAFYAPHQSGAGLNAGPAIWSEHYSFGGVARMVALLAFEVGVYGLWIGACWASLDRKWRAIGVTIAIASVVWVLVPETVGHGGFTMRSSIPTLFLLVLMILKVLASKPPRYVRVALTVCLVLGAGSAIQEFTRSILRYPATIPAPRPEGGVLLGLNKRHRGEFVMPTDSRLYRLFYRTPPVSP